MLLHKNDGKYSSLGCFAHKVAHVSQFPGYNRDDAFCEQHEPVAEYPERIVFPVTSAIDEWQEESYMFTHVDHIGFAVKDLDQAVEFYTNAFNITEWERISMADRGMEMAVTRFGDTLLELIMPTSSEGAIGKFIEKNGPGIHHIAYRVDDIEASMKEVEARGLRLIDKAPRPGIHNTKIAFLHPRNGDQGVLMELVQHQDAH